MDNTTATAATVKATAATTATTATAPPSPVEMMSPASYAAIINTEVIKGHHKHKILYFNISGFQGWNLPYLGQSQLIASNYF